MRIDGASPIPSAVPQSVARDARPAARVREAGEPGGQGSCGQFSPGRRPDSTNVLVEMQPGNIVVYKFIDEASGRLIQQIPAEQLLNLSQSAEAAPGKKRT